MALTDPFYLVKSEIEQALGATRVLRDSFRQLLQSTNTATNEEFSWTMEQLKNNLKDIEDDLQDLEETITIVEKNPHKFKVDVGELKSRKAFIGDARMFIQDVRSEMGSAETRAKMEKDRREDLMRSKAKAAQNERFAAVQREHEQDNQRFIDANDGQVLLQRQDEQLEVVADSVKRLKHIAVDITTEVDSQNRMLDELDESVDSTSGRLKAAMQRMTQVYKKNKDGKSLCFIAFLVVVVVILGILTLTI